jgi:hypothetical protein
MSESVGRDRRQFIDNQDCATAPVCPAGCYTLPTPGPRSVDDKRGSGQLRRGGRVARFLDCSHRRICRTLHLALLPTRGPVFDIERQVRSRALVVVAETAGHADLSVRHGRLCAKDAGVRDLHCMALVSARSDES